MNIIHNKSSVVSKYSGVMSKVVLLLWNKTFGCTVCDHVSWDSKDLQSYFVRFKSAANKHRYKNTSGGIYISTSPPDAYELRGQDWCCCRGFESFYWCENDGTSTHAALSFVFADLMGCLFRHWAKSLNWMVENYDYPQPAELLSVIWSCSLSFALKKKYNTNLLIS